MKNFKIQQQSKGFVFAEVVIALAIMAVLLTPVLMLQYTVFKRVIINRERIEHLMPLKTFFGALLIDPLKENETTRRQDLEEPPMQIVYERYPATGIFERFKDLFFEKVSGTWHGSDRKKEEMIFQCIFVPEQLKKEQK